MADKAEDPHAKEDPAPAFAASASGVWSVPMHAAFLDSIAAGLLQETAGNPVALADYTILVPDRAAREGLKAAFLAQWGGKPGILPRIDAPGDMDEDTLALKVSGSAMLTQALMDIPPPVSPLERQMVLASEILKIPGMASSVQKAVKLGGELGRFIDLIQRHDVDLAAASHHVAPQFAKQWEKTSKFLEIVTDRWPEYLRQKGMTDPEEHRSAMTRIRAAHWQDQPPAYPVLAVGFSDVTPAEGELLAAIAAMPQGRVVLPGFDPLSYRPDLKTVHPQSVFHALIDDLGIDAAAVRDWPVHIPKTSMPRSTTPDRTYQGRVKLLRAAMQSPFGQMASVGKEALSGMDVLICGSPQEEASVIALKLRETLETPGKTAMLVTPDRDLARRVRARLRQWSIEIDDAAGMPLAETSAGIFLQASAQMAATGWAPVPMLEALKHPLASLGLDPSLYRERLDLLEDRLLRGARPSPHAEGLNERLQSVFNRVSPRADTPDMQRRALEKAGLADFITRLQTAGDDFFKLMSGDKAERFSDLLDAHVRFAEALAATHDKVGAERLWRGADGVAAARFLSSLRAAGDFLPDMKPADYADVLQGLMRDAAARPRATGHPDLRILTPAAAFLEKADTVIVGGLNDDVWPGIPDDNPWIPPDMMPKLGLPEPGEYVGRSALAFVQMASSPNVMLTRSMRSGDAPTVASPFMLRLLSVLESSGLDAFLKEKSQLLDIHRTIHAPRDVMPVEPPEPRPERALRPKKLSVSAIESLLRDPYAVYARYILKLRPKAPIDALPSASERGMFTHAALDAFQRKYPDAMPDNAYDILLDIGRETFKTRMSSPAVTAFWWPRFERIAKWFVGFETERRDMSRTLGTEIHGKMDIDLGDEIFTLTTIADRLDIDADDNLIVIDYKTGSVPSQKSVGDGMSPQLTLEALIAFTGGFEATDAGNVGKLQYWKLSGGRPAGEVIEVKGDVRMLVDAAREGVINLVRTFSDKDTPYLAAPRPDLAPRFNDYAHLSRVGEWSTVKKVTARKKNPRKKDTAKGEEKKKPLKKTAGGKP